MKRRSVAAGAYFTLDVMFLRASLRFIAGVTAALAAVVSAAQAPTTAHPHPADAYSAARYGGGDGLSQENAVVVEIASDTGGVASEYVWINHTYPGAKSLRQALTPWMNGKRYDIMTVETAEGQRIKLWFDIAAMYK